MGDLSSVGFADGDAESIAFGLPSSDYVTVEDADGNEFIPLDSSANDSQVTYVEVTL